MSLCWKTPGQYLFHSSRDKEKNELEIEKNGGGITWKSEKRVKKQNRGRNAGLCTSVLVALVLPG